MSKISRAVIVLGCFRSGTSAIAGVLHHLGVFMGDRFDPPNSVNPRGYWEDLDFKDMLRDTTFENHNLEDQIKNLIIRRCRDHEIWGFKYPEACIMMPWIDDLFASAPCPYSIISIDRDKEAICGSIGRAMQDNRDFRKLVDHYYEKRDLFLSQFDGMVLRLKFPEFLEDPTATVTCIANFVGLSVDQSAIDHITWSPDAV